MSGNTSGYDLSVSTYSPDGRILQIEYAQKAAEMSGTAMGIRVKDGVVLAVEKLIHTKLMVAESNRRIQSADLHIGIVSAGLVGDGQHLVNCAREEAQSWRGMYKQQIPGKSIADRLGQYVSAYTMYASVRPFGLNTIMATMTKDEPPALYMIEQNGVFWNYHGIAVGKGKSVAKTELEKLDFQNMTVRDAVNEITRIIYTCHDEAKDKEFQLELSWICAESDYTHQDVPKEIKAEAERLANESLNNGNDEMED